MRYRAASYFFDRPLSDSSVGHSHWISAPFKAHLLTIMANDDSDSFPGSLVLWNNPRMVTCDASRSHMWVIAIVTAEVGLPMNSLFSIKSEIFLATNIFCSQKVGSSHSCRTLQLWTLLARRISRARGEPHPFSGS